MGKRSGKGFSFPCAAPGGCGSPGPFGAWPRSWRPRCGGGWPVEAKRRVLLREGAIGLEAVARLEAWVRLGDLAL